MTLKRISDEKILMALLPSQPESQRASAVTPGQRRVAQAQLEADLKAHNAVIKRLFKEIEGKGDRGDWYYES